MYYKVAVGVNLYPGAELRGCVEDIESLKVMNIALPQFVGCIELLDGEATTENIHEALTDTVAKLTEDDILMFQYSGHGTLTAHKHEAICPVDFDWTEGHMLTDQNLVDIFEHMPEGSKLYWLSDSCHAGGLSRNPVLRTDIVGRCYPLEAPFQDYGMARVPIARTLQQSPKIKAEVGYVAGCMHSQTSADALIDGKWCGAFTHYFIEALLQKPMATMARLCSKTHALLHTNGYEQNPQVDGILRGSRFLA